MLSLWKRCHLRYSPIYLLVFPFQCNSFEHTTYYTQIFLLLEHCYSYNCTNTQNKNGGHFTKSSCDSNKNLKIDYMLFIIRFIVVLEKSENIMVRVHIFYKKPFQIKRGKKEKFLPFISVAE